MSKSKKILITVKKSKVFSLLLLNKLLIKIWFCEKRDNSL